MHELETTRLTLRPWAEADALALFHWARDPEVGPRAGWEPHASVEESAKIIREVLAVPESYAIVVRDRTPEDDPIGAIGLKFGAASELAHGASEAELGYWLARPFWGCGYMPEAGRALLAHAFNDLRLKVVWAGHYEGNLQSRRVMEKLGLTETRTRDAEGRIEHVLCVTRAQWGNTQAAAEKNALP